MGNRLTDALAALNGPKPEQREMVASKIMTLEMNQPHEAPETDLDSVIQAQAATSVYEKSMWIRREPMRKWALRTMAYGEEH